MNTDSVDPKRPPIQADLDGLVAAITGPLTYSDAVIAVSHSNYRTALGGTEKVLVEEQDALFRRRISYIQIYPAKPEDQLPSESAYDQPIGINIDSRPMAILTLLQFMLVLQAMIKHRAIRLAAVHLHHLMHFSKFGLGFLLETLGPVPIRFFVHDYYSVCSSFNLLNHDNEYCGPGSSIAEGCGSCRRCPNPEEHRRSMGSFFRRVQPEVIAPSETAAHIWLNYYPDASKRVRVVPHQIVEPIRPQIDGGEGDGSSRAIASTLRIAYVGYEQVNKGLDTWWRLCGDDHIQRTCRLYHLGTAGKRLQGVTYVPVSFQEDGPDGMIEALVRHEIDVVLLWSIWPETYSFTFFEALAAGCFVITNQESGNIFMQVRQWGCGMDFETESEMLRFLSDRRQLRSALGNRHRQRGKRFCLRFNPELAELAREASFIPETWAVESSPGIDGDLEIWLRNWFLFVSQKESIDQLLRGELNSKKHESDQMRTQLNVYQNSRMHRSVEMFRKWWVRHPILQKYIHPVVAGVCRPLLRIFLR